MNNKRLFSICALLLLLVAFIKIPARAESLQFTTDPASEEKYAVLTNSLSLHLLREEPQKQQIVCFAVDSDGRLALGLESLQQKYICVCDAGGAFQYAIEFTSAGTFDLAWDGRNIVLFLVRGKSAVTISPSGEIIRAEIVQNTVENDRRWRENLSAVRRVEGEKEYRLQNDFGAFHLFAGGYSQLLMTDASGESTVLYDASESTLAGIICRLAIILALALICVLTVKEFKSGKKNKKL